MSNLVLSVPDIVDEESERQISEAISSLPGVEGVAVDVAGKKVSLTFDDYGGDLETVWRVLGDAGFEVSEAWTE